MMLIEFKFILTIVGIIFFILYFIRLKKFLILFIFIAFIYLLVSSFMEIASKCTTGNIFVFKEDMIKKTENLLKEIKSKDQSKSEEIALDILNDLKHRF